MEWQFFKFKSLKTKVLHQKEEDLKTCIIWLPIPPASRALTLHQDPHG